jgi:hypothetical protein
MFEIHLVPHFVSEDIFIWIYHQSFHFYDYLKANSNILCNVMLNIFIYNYKQFKTALI